MRQDKDDPPQKDDWRPAASLELLQRRAEMLRTIRNFFHENGFWEVETPLLSQDCVVDAHLDPFVTRDHAGRTLFLQTSPEFAMKRLLAAGAEAVFQLTKAFRQEEFGRIHNPEFTMLEWYRVGDDHHAQMDFTERLVSFVWKQHAKRQLLQSFERLTYDDAFHRYAGTKVLALTAGELRALVGKKKIDPPAGLVPNDRDGWLNLLLATCLAPNLGSDRPVFLYDYPATQAALAKIRDDKPPVAERFELYINGMEICNGYHELAEPQELRRRIVQQAEIRRRDGLYELPSTNRLLAAMEHGLPASSGVALGVDRLAMLVFQLESLFDVLAFPIDRA